jgi:hypothetical protein
MAGADPSRIVRPLLLSFAIVASLAAAQSADAPLTKTMVAPSEMSEVVPECAPRMVSRREIYQAIQDALAQRGIAGRELLTPEDLQIQASVPALVVDMGLILKNIRYNPIRREMVFALWTSQQPQFLPFVVTTKRDLAGLQLNRPAGGTGEAGGDYRALSPITSPRATPKPPVLVKPGAAATLIMLGRNARITLSVLPLQPGAKGQTILVRDLATARVMAAKVIDTGLLQTRF